MHLQLTPAQSAWIPRCGGDVPSTTAQAGAVFPAVYAESERAADGPGCAPTGRWDPRRGARVVPDSSRVSRKPPADETTGGEWEPPGPLEGLGRSGPRLTATVAHQRAAGCIRVRPGTRRARPRHAADAYHTTPTRCRRSVLLHDNIFGIDGDRWPCTLERTFAATVLGGGDHV